MEKRELGVLLREARLGKGLSLRQLSEQTGIDHSRLARIEYGTRPAPTLAKMRQLAEILALNMGDLLVASGTPRAVVEQLLWSERLRISTTEPALARYQPAQSSLQAKNMFDVEVLRREGARCAVQWGNHELTVFSFSRTRSVRIVVPPEVVLVFNSDPRGARGSEENVFAAFISKVRHVGELTNLVLQLDAVELNALSSKRGTDDAGIEKGGSVYVLIPSAAIRTIPTRKDAE
jgi:transcriptional regulator with XRE-family HTH domain